MLWGFNSGFIQLKIKICVGIGIMHLSSGECFEAYAEVHSVTSAEISRKCYPL